MCPEHVHSTLHLATCQKMFDPVVMQITNQYFDKFKQVYKVCRISEALSEALTIALSKASLDATI